MLYIVNMLGYSNYDRNNLLGTETIYVDDIIASDDVNITDYLSASSASFNTLTLTSGYITNINSSFLTMVSSSITTLNASDITSVSITAVNISATLFTSASMTTASLTCSGINCCNVSLTTKLTTQHCSAWNISVSRTLQIPNASFTNVQRSLLYSDADSKLYYYTGSVWKGVTLS